MADFTTYLQLRDTTRAAAIEADKASASHDTASQAVQDAQATLDAAAVAKQESLDTWEKAERAENAEATKIGIDPTPVTPPA